MNVVKLFEGEVVALKYTLAHLHYTANAGCAVSFHMTVQETALHFCKLGVG